MVKQQKSLNDKIKLRCAIQIFAKDNPEKSNVYISKLFGVSKKYVARWKNKTRFLNAKRKRKSKLSKKMKKFLINAAKNKLTGYDNASCRKIAKKINKKFSLEISYQTVNRWLNKIIDKPIKSKKTFLLRDKDKVKRKNFAKYIIQNNIKGEDIFFTDEKRFLLYCPPNKQNNQMRLDRIGKEQVKTRKGKIFEKLAKPLPKYSPGFMVAGGLSSKGVGKLIFVHGTMNSFSYLQALKMYGEDIKNLDENLYFQQDGATCHTSKKATNFINLNFKNKLLWPPNSPDISPIETLWSLLEEKLYCNNFKNIEEMAKKLQQIWNKIPKKICKNLISGFDEKIEALMVDGERVDNIRRNDLKFSGEWKNKWTNDNNMRIVYNEESLKVLKDKKIKALKRELKLIKERKTNASKRYCIKNKLKIKKASKECYDLFLKQEKEMKELYQKEINDKKEEIEIVKILEGEELFGILSQEEKMKMIKIGKKSKVNNSTASTAIE